MASTEMVDQKALKFASFEDFFVQYDGVSAEWVNGEVIVMSPASDRHQDLSGFLESVLRIFVETKNIGVIRSAPFVMRLEEQQRGREPDLLFVASAHRDQKTYLNGPADLAIEIVSEESIGRDRGEKFAEYKQGGVSEFWLIDPIREQAEFYHLIDGRYRVIAPTDGVYQSEFQRVNVPTRFKEAKKCHMIPASYSMRHSNEYR